MTVVRSIWCAFGCAAALTLPRAAEACAVCAGQDDAAVSLALLKGTALLSLLPLALIGGLVWFLRRRAREIEANRGALRVQESPR
jgi:hypothetical protein